MAVVRHGYRLSDEDVRRFQEDGFVLTDSPIDPSYFSLICSRHAEIEPYWQSRTWPKELHALATQFACMGEIAFRLPEQEQFLAVAQTALNSGPVFVGCCGAGNTVEVEAKDSRPRQQLQWHSTPGRNGELGDGYTQVALRFAMDEHNELNGGLRIVPGSHRVPKTQMWEQLKSDLRQSPDFEEWNGLLFGSHPKQVEIFLKPGQMLIWTPNVWHSTGVNRSGSKRRAITWIYFPPGGRFRDHKTLTAILGSELTNWPETRRRLWGFA
jgi:Phytanoyl-CoA dioxygenase (PhyH)